jgi:hypothetical protein
MTSVLTYGGLNYQNGNPLRGEIMGLKRENDNLRKLVNALYADVTMLRAELGKVMPEGTVLPSLAMDAALAPPAPAAPAAPAYGGAAYGGAAGGAAYQPSVPVYNPAIRRN